MHRCAPSQRLLLLLLPLSIAASDVKVSAETVALCDATTLTKNYQNIGCKFGERSIKMDGLVNSTSLELETGWTCMLRCRSNGVAGYLQCDDEGQWTGNTRCDDKVEVEKLTVLRRSKRGFRFRRSIRRIGRGIRRVIRFVLPPWGGGRSPKYPPVCRIGEPVSLPSYSFVAGQDCCHLMCEPPLPTTCTGGMTWNACGSYCSVGFKTCAEVTSTLTPTPSSATIQSCPAACRGQCECPRNAPVWYNGVCAPSAVCAGDVAHDREPPTITCPVVTSPQYAPTGSDQAVVNFDLPTAEDNDGHTPQ